MKSVYVRHLTTVDLAGRIFSTKQKLAHCISMLLRPIRTGFVPSSTRYRFLDYVRYHWTTLTKHVEVGVQL